MSFVELNDSILRSEALQIHYFLRELHTNHYVVSQNFRELYQFLQKAQDPEAVTYLWVAGKRAELDLAMAEVTRLLLNFITAASARTNSSRRMIKSRYKGKPFFDLYQRVVNHRIKGKPVVGFVEDLRNYSLHYALPLAGAHWKYEQDPAMQTGTYRQFFALSKEGLISSKFVWSEEKGKPYLAQAAGDILVQEFTTEYFVLIHNFQVWVEQTLYDQHRDELDWLYEASAEIKAAMDKIMESWESNT
ncbi:MAG: hypothetical protein DCC55_35680 [Chloroflexi bacterium]|nr:MAG: hypothetical protein DCC55_35680 [Chloroflexota bacterium]